ncbi:MAG TPA: STAS domain-containing protein [bacterium]|nr:STAS domain-containing protein [bacterium]HQL62271.1 STAS domain-containing protein [bacterium]
MNIVGYNDRDVLVFRIEGRLDSDTCERVSSQLDSWVDSGEMWLVGDLSDLEYINTFGIRVFLSAHRKLLIRGGSLVLFGLKETAKEIFGITGVGDMIPVVASKADALAMIQRG